MLALENNNLGNLLGVLYRFHLKLNISVNHISWKGYLIRNFPPKFSIHLMAYKKNRQLEEMPPLVSESINNNL
jgi:hypothetical protein